MTKAKIALLAGMAFIIFGASLPSGLNAADDALTTIAKRRALMRAQAAHAAAIDDFVEKGVGDPAVVAANAMGLFATAKLVPDLFPQGSGMDAYPGKTGAKPEIWANLKEFQAGAARLEEESSSCFKRRKVVTSRPSPINSPRLARTRAAVATPSFGRSCNSSPTRRRQPLTYNRRRRELSPRG